MKFRASKATIRRVFCSCVAVLLLFALLLESLRQLASTQRSSHHPYSFDVIGRAQTDRRLVDHIRKRIVAPSSLPYNLSRPQLDDFSQFQQTVVLKTYFKNTKNGFFIEVGAFDGEHHSNTLYFERDHGWEGLLIEAILPTYESLLTKHRRAHSLHACLCSTNVTHTVTFNKTNTEATMKIKPTETTSPSGGRFEMPCFPLYSILAAINFPTVHLLSLDIEGFELAVLKTLPLRRLDIRLLLVEYINIPDGFPALQKHLGKKGYRLKEKLVFDGLFVKDLK